MKRSVYNKIPMCAILYSYHEKRNTYMPKGTNQKLKLYRLAQIMLENTDDEHYITMPEIPVRERCDDDSGR